MRTIALAEGRASSQSSDDQDLLQDMRDSLLSSTSSAGNIPYRWREMEQSLSSGETRKKPQLNLNIWLNLLRERLEYLSSDLKDDISASYGTISPDQVEGVTTTTVLRLRVDFLFKPDDMLRSLQIMGPLLTKLDDDEGKIKPSTEKEHRIVWSTRRAPKESVVVLDGLCVNNAYWDAGALVEALPSTEAKQQRGAASTKGPTLFGKFVAIEDEKEEKEEKENNRMFDTPVVVGELDVGCVLLNKGKVADSEYWLRRSVHLSS
jgi:hypothetical protein